MKLLLDTHLLLWAAGGSDKLPGSARALISDRNNDLLFSAASFWEIAIKRGLRRPDFDVQPVRLRNGLLANGYAELPITSAHAMATERLPAIHRDPFDRLLVAQAESEGIRLLTADATLPDYGDVVLKI